MVVSLSSGTNFISADVAAVYGLGDLSPAMWAFLKIRFDSAVTADYNSYQDERDDPENCQEYHHLTNLVEVHRYRTILSSGTCGRCLWGKALFFLPVKTPTRSRTPIGRNGKQGRPAFGILKKHGL